MRIIALDPGGTTGVATYVDGEWSRFELKGDHHDELVAKVSMFCPDVVIYERFQYQRRELDKGVSLVLVSVEYIGCLKYLYQSSRFDGETWELIEQTPAQAKNLFTDDKLRRLDLWSSSPHERDATRHLLYYLVVKLQQRSWIDRLR